MSIIGEGIEAINIVAKSIANVRAIVDAVREGKDYLVRKHPQARIHVAAMLEEMAKTMQVVREAATTLTGFWFAAGSINSLAEFNALYRKHQEQAQNLVDRIEALRGHCSVIREHAFAIEVDQAGGGQFAGVFRLLGLSSPQREAELGDRLDKLAYEDFAVANAGEAMLRALRVALDEVQNILGPNRVMDAANIPAAGRRLAEHAANFQPLADNAERAVRSIRELSAELAK